VRLIIKYNNYLFLSFLLTFYPVSIFAQQPQGTSKDAKKLYRFKQVLEKSFDDEKLICRSEEERSIKRETALTSAMERFQESYENVFKVQNKYRNDATIFWTTRKTQLQIDELIKSKKQELNALHAQSLSKQKFIDDVINKEKDLISLWKNESPPVHFYRLTGQIRTKYTRGLSEEEAQKVIFNHLQEKARSQFTAFMEEKYELLLDDNKSHKKLDEKQLKKVLKLYSSSVAFPLDQETTRIPFCLEDVNGNKNQILIYYASALYAVEKVPMPKEGVMYRNESLQNNPNDIKPMVESMGSTLYSEYIFPKIKDKEFKYCDLNDQKGFERYFHAVARQERKAIELNESQKEYWLFFHKNQEEILNKIRDNKNYLVRLEEEKTDIDKRAFGIEGDVKNWEIERKKIIDILPRLDELKRISRKEYISKMAQRELEVVIENIADMENIVEGLLIQGEKEAGANFVASIVELSMGGDKEEMVRKSISEDLQKTLVAATPICWARKTKGEILIASLLFKISVPIQGVYIRDYDDILSIDTIKEIRPFIYHDYGTGLEWWHVGDNDEIGYRYDKCRKIKDTEDGRWRLPKKEELEEIRSQGVSSLSRIPGLKDNIPYWTGEIHSNGNPIGICFGRKGNCAKRKRKKTFNRYQDYNKGRALAILLVRDAEKK